VKKYITALVVCFVLVAPSFAQYSAQDAYEALENAGTYRSTAQDDINALDSTIQGLQNYGYRIDQRGQQVFGSMTDEDKHTYQSEMTSGYNNTNAASRRLGTARTSIAMGDDLFTAAQSYYNQGLTYEQQGDNANATAQYTLCVRAINGYRNSNNVWINGANNYFWGASQNAQGALSAECSNASTDYSAAESLVMQYGG
jgi:hypothetical protein